MVFEVLGNAVNEALEGHADLIEVTLNDDGSVTVSDNGRGVPIDVDQNEWLSVTAQKSVALFAARCYQLRRLQRPARPAPSAAVEAKTDP